jgi:hypothetical protein
MAGLREGSTRANVSAAQPRPCDVPDVVPAKAGRRAVTRGPLLASALRFVLHATAAKLVGNHPVA